MGIIIIILLLMIAASSSRGDDDLTAILVEVDASGNGDYTRIQDAIDHSVPSNNSRQVFILLRPGIYREKIVIPSDKPLVTISGTRTRAAQHTLIVWGDSGDIFLSPTVSVFASDFMARYLTIQNSYGVGAKAVALRVSGDRAAFIGCRILSRQDTLLDDSGRHFYSNSYIEGDVDFIFGNAASLFLKCHLHSLAEGDGAITAQRRESSAEETGFTFLECKITGVKTALLGRPWGAYSRVVFARTYMSGAVLPQGWVDWGDSGKRRTVYYGEYKCYGPGARRSERVNWSRRLSAEEAAPYLVGGASWIRSAVPSRFHRVVAGVNVRRTINGSHCTDWIC